MFLQSSIFTWQFPVWLIFIQMHAGTSWHSVCYVALSDQVELFNMVKEVHAFYVPVVIFQPGCPFSVYLWWK